jgi:hypothetical protein
MQIHCRGALQRPVYVKQRFPRARPEGWRAERRKLIVSASIAGRGGRLPARHMRVSEAHAICGVFVSAGPRFPLPAMAGRSVSS